jgi:simple sugar transport system substrate-binding protein
MIRILLLITTILGFSIGSANADPKKVGFIYIGPPGDHGWTYMHDVGRQYMESQLGDAVTSTYIENVPENADAVRAIRKLAASGHDLIFTTSFNYMDQTLEVAKEFPDIKFEHATGYMRAPNVSTYSARFYEGRTISGHIAGKMTKSNVIGYIASFPIPEVVRGINAFYLAASKVNPDIQIKIIWAFTWYDPGKEADAANTLINQGADILVQHTDTFAPCQAAEKAGVLAFGQASNQEEFCPNSHLTAIEDIWGPYYAQRAKAVVDGTWAEKDTWDGMAEGMVVMSPYNTKLMPTDLIQEAVAMEVAIKDGSLHPFTGPIYDQSGELRVAEGEVADDFMMATMDWYVQGIDGELPQ